ncbi:hypothetical protein GCM10020254_71630 [Streptomyces goshikiensis]
MENPWVMNRAIARPETTIIAVTVEVPPPSAATVPCTRASAPRSLCANPRTATRAAATTSSTRKMPVIQALARRSSRPARVASSITPPPATGAGISMIGAR